MKALLNHVLSYLPGPLPVGMSQFNQWARDVLDLSGRFADEDSMLFALASMVIHADAKHGYLPKRYFVLRLRKVAANQIASQVFQDIKIRQAEAAQQLQKAAEATPVQEVQASDVQAPH